MERFKKVYQQGAIDVVEKRECGGIYAIAG